MLHRNPLERIQAIDALSEPFVMKTYLGFRNKDGKLMENTPEDTLTMEEVLLKMRKFAELPELKRAAIVTLAHMVGTNAESLQKHRLTFRRLDLDGDGSVDKEEFLF